MTLSAISIGIDFQHQYFDKAFLDTLEKLEEYDYCVVDPKRMENLVKNLSLHDVHLLFAQLRNRIYTYMSNGGKVVCFLRPLTIWENITSYDWVVKLEDPASRTVIQPLSSGRCQVTNLAREWRQYLEYQRIKCLACWSYNFPRTDVLAYVENRAVAVRISIGTGVLVFLPPPRDQDHKHLFIRALRRSIERDHGAEDDTVLPEWVHRYRLRKEVEYANVVKELDERIRDLTLEREMQKQQAQRLSRLRTLLWGTGVASLEDAVQDAFRILGFDVTPQYPIDLVLKSELGIAFVEIEGTAKMVRVRKIEQLLRYMLNHLAETDDTVKGILVGNAFRLTDPQERPPIEEHFSLETQKFAELNNVALISTITLYELVDKVLMNEIELTKLHSLIFHTNGILRLDKYNQ